MSRSHRARTARNRWVITWEEWVREHRFMSFTAEPRFFRYTSRTRTYKYPYSTKHPKRQKLTQQYSIRNCVRLKRLILSCLRHYSIITIDVTSRQTFGRCIQNVAYIKYIHQRPHILLFLNSN